jgi:hypothetical protein
MKIRIIKDHEKKSIYKQMIKKIYNKDQTFKNNKEGLFALVCNSKGVFYKKSKQVMITVSVEKDLHCQGVLICHEQQPKVLYLAFFEAVMEAKESVEHLLNYAEAYGKAQGCDKLVIGIDGHCNNGLGFVTIGSGHPSFGEAYNPAYYADFFKSFEGHTFVSYKDEVQSIAPRVEYLRNKLHLKMTPYTLEAADFSRKGLRASLKRYTDLNNNIFTDHSYYFRRDYDEDVELFKSMMPLMDHHNLLFVKKDGKDIGFILWYPDFNELVKKNKGAGILTFLQYKLLKRRPKTIKIVEIGVEAKYRGTPAIFILFNGVMEAAEKASHDSQQLISSWIHGDNSASRQITSRFAQKPYREYVTYEKKI